MTKTRTACELCEDTEVPDYPLQLELSGPNFKRLARPIRLCADCIAQMFFGESGQRALKC